MNNRTDYLSYHNLSVSSPYKRDASPSPINLRERSPIPYSLEQLQELKTKLEDENQQLKKQLRQKEAEVVKTQAVLQQKVDLLQVQLNDAKEREENQKKMTDKMMSVFGEDKKEGRSQESMERQLKEDKHNFQHVENKLKQLQEKYEKMSYEYEHYKMDCKVKFTTFELKTKQLEETNKRLQYDLEMAQMKNKQNMSTGVGEQGKHQKSNSYHKICSLNSARQEIKQTRNQKEIEDQIEKIRNTQLQALSHIKLSNEAERDKFEKQLNKLKREMLSQRDEGEKSTNRGMTVEQSNKYLKELQTLNTYLQQFKKQTEEDISQVKKEREDALKKVENLEKENNQLKFKLKKAIEDYQRIHKLKSQTKQETSQLDKLQQKLSKYKQKITVLNTQVQKLDTAERKLKNLILEKESEHEKELIQMKRLLKAEKKQNQSNSIEEFKEGLHQVLQEKDQQIKNLQVALSQKESHLNSHKKSNSVFNSKRKSLQFSPDVYIDTIPEETQTSIILATQILELGKEIVCSQCGIKFNIKNFLKHIQEDSCKLDTSVGECPQPMPQVECSVRSQEKSMFDKKFDSVKKQKTYRVNFGSQRSDRPSPMKQFSLINLIPDQLKQNSMEMGLPKDGDKSKDKIRELMVERDKLQSEYEKVVMELKRTKIELAMAEERRTESEQCYKNEIKYLIDKLLKVKNKLNKERQQKEELLFGDCNVEQSTLLDAGCSFISQNINLSTNNDYLVSKPVFTDKTNVSQTQFKSFDNKIKVNQSAIQKNQGQNSNTNTNRSQMLEQLEKNAIMKIIQASPHEISLFNDYDQMCPSKQSNISLNKVNMSVAHQSRSRAKSTLQVNKQAGRIVRNSSQSKERFTARHAYQFAESSDDEPPQPGDSSDFSNSTEARYQIQS